MCFAKKDTLYRLEKLSVSQKETNAKHQQAVCNLLKKKWRLVFLDYLTIKVRGKRSFFVSLHQE